MRIARALTLVGGAAAAALCACAPAPPAAPNVLLIVLDALSAGHVGHLGYGRDTTPHIDALAARGVSYTRAYAPAPYTLASIPSLLTGRLPDRHGVVQKRFRLADSERTLAEQAARAGLLTFGAVGNMNGSELYGMHQGFGEFHNLMRGEDSLVRGAETGVPAELVVPRAPSFVKLMKRWLGRGHGRDQPAFFYLHLLEPHSPYQPPAEFRERWLDPNYDGPFAAGDNETLIGSNFGRVPVGPADVEAVRALYDANLAYVDHHVGLLMDALERAGVRESTHVVLTSDHGEAFWQHDRWGHNEHLYDEALHVPLVMDLAGLGQPEGLEIGEQVSTMDVFPTLSALLGAELPGASLDGIDLLGGALDPGRELIFLSHAELPDLALRTLERKAIALQVEGQGFVRLELYDLEADPGELQDRGPGAEAAEREAVWSRIQSWREALREDAPAPEAARELSAAEQAMLETLGYVDGR